jgi:hypothetical protein
MSSLNCLCLERLRCGISLAASPIPRILTASKPTARLKNGIKPLGGSSCSKGLPGNRQPYLFWIPILKEGVFDKTVFTA